jgi:predicted ATP-binding protein involved in virulence
MRIEQLQVANFKGFTSREFSFHPEFNLLVGTNGSGKTSALDALSIAIGSWFLGVRGADSRHIRTGEVTLGDFEEEDIDEQGERHFGIKWERLYPCTVSASGKILGKQVSWSRALNSPKGRTTYVDATSIKTLAAEADRAVRSGGEIALPLISYYGTGRLWQEPREAFQVDDPQKVTDKSEQSRLAGYRNSVDPRLSVGQLTRWIARQSWISYQKRSGGSPTFKAVTDAIVRCVERGENVFFDASLGEVVIELAGGGTQPFSNLSDGQRCMMALVGDIAQKAATLNPHLGADVLAKTEGVVLIDELDLHLHPKWQRHIVEDLRTTFPRVQFICTTHSPFLIQSLRSGEELVVLDGQPTAQLGDLSIEDIAKGIQGVPNTEVSARYEEMKGVAASYLRTLDEAAKAPQEQLEEYKARLADSISPYADNPAFQAFLELKRAAKLGE